MLTLMSEPLVQKRPAVNYNGIYRRTNSISIRQNWGIQNMEYPRDGRKIPILFLKLENVENQYQRAKTGFDISEDILENVLNHQVNGT